MVLSINVTNNRLTQNSALAGKTGVRTQHADYIKYLPKWQKCRDTIAGEDTIKMSGVTYLPKLKDQTPEDYVGYVLRGTFYNATARTISGLLGMLFRKPPVADTPTGIDPYLKDVDMCGKPIDVFANEVSEEVISIGRVGLLVDYVQAVQTPDGQTLTVATAEKLNLRPLLKIYTAETIINWRFKQINNVWTLCMLVLTEQFSFQSLNSQGKIDEFSNATETRYRVLDLMDDTTYRQRVFRVNDKEEDILVSTTIPLMNNQPLAYIPFIAMNEDGVGFDLEEPPLYDLVNVNLGHWRISADYEHGCHFTALPTLLLTGYSPPVPEQGVEPDKICLGSQAAITMSDPGSDGKFIEFTGQGLTAVSSNLDRKEAQMAVLGARMLASEGKSQQSTTTTAIHRTGENSVLSSISIAVSLGIEKALGWFSEWAGYAVDIQYQINRDFLPVIVDGPTLTALFAGVQAGQLNKEEMFDWLQRADVIEADVTYEDHLKGDFVAPPAAPTVDPVTGLPTSPKPASVGSGDIKPNPEKP